VNIKPSIITVCTAFIFTNHKNFIKSVTKSFTLTFIVQLSRTPLFYSFRIFRKNLHLQLTAKIFVQLCVTNRTQYKFVHKKEEEKRCKIRWSNAFLNIYYFEFSALCKKNSSLNEKQFPGRNKKGTLHSSNLT